MIKTMKLLFTFLLLVIPTISVARDRCTNPGAYTVDRRCYVNDIQKHQKPFNASVALGDNAGVPYARKEFDFYCSGTIVKRDEKLYIYTAKHCVVDSNTDVVADTISFRLQDGTSMRAYRDQVGDFIMSTGKNRSGDWAIYEIRDASDNVPYVDLSNNPTPKVISVGYGALKIMSDNEIWDFKQKYLEYLYTNPDKRAGKDWKFIDGGVYIEDPDVEKFIVKIGRDFARDFFVDLKLKVSECYYVNSKPIGCQGWGGDSGGGMFDANGNLVSIHSTGAPIVGGAYHGRSWGQTMPNQ